MLSTIMIKIPSEGISLRNCKIHESCFGSLGCNNLLLAHFTLFFPFIFSFKIPVDLFTAFYQVIDEG